MTEVKEFGSHPLQEFIPNKKVDSRDPAPSFSNLRNLRNLWFQIRNLGLKPLCSGDLYLFSYPGCQVRCDYRFGYRPRPLPNVS